MNLLNTLPFKFKIAEDETISFYGKRLKKLELLPTL